MTSPYIHDGSYTRLEDVIQHHIDPVDSLRKYKPHRFIYQQEVVRSFDDRIQREAIATIETIGVPRFRSPEIENIISFLMALTAPKLEKRSIESISESVPSGQAEAR